MNQVACHMIHSQSQLSNQQNIDWLKQAKVVIVGAGWPDYTSVKLKAPDAKLLVSFNAHMLYMGNNSQYVKFLEALTPHLLKDENGLPIPNIDYPAKNNEFKFSKSLAKAHAKAIWEMIKGNPQIDGVYMDDCWGALPQRYISAYSNYYVNYQAAYKEYREALLRSLLYRLPNEMIFICNTAGALARGTSGVTIEQHTNRELAIETFTQQKGFWNVAWFYNPAIEIENNNLRVLRGVSLNN